MDEQNIYDDGVFFEDYSHRRNDETCLNEILEQPKMLEMAPDVKCKRVLDIGCGHGKNAFKFMKDGASYCLAIDISQNMIDEAESKNKYKNLKFLQFSMNDLDKIDEKFDFIYSSLAFHYVEDWSRLFNNISRLLNKGGVLLFSTGNPIRVGDSFPNGWIHNEQDEVVGFKIANYSDDGKRMAKWWDKYDVELYHHKYSTLLNCMAKAKLFIEEACEPQGDEHSIALNKKVKKMQIAPSYLIIKAVKL